MILYALEFLIGDDFDMINILCLFLLFHIWNFMSCMYQGTTYSFQRADEKGKIEAQGCRRGKSSNYCI